MLWFDVGIKRYTTPASWIHHQHELWFDVGIKRYTTQCNGLQIMEELWFDVGIKRYTTGKLEYLWMSSCGLM